MYLHLTAAKASEQTHVHVYVREYIATVFVNVAVILFILARCATMMSKK